MKDMILNRSYRFLVCLVCCLFVVSSLGLAFAVDPTPSPTPVPTPEIIPDPLLQIIDATAMEYLWLTMRAWGINIEYNGYREFSEDVKNWLINQVFEYFQDTNQSQSISLWVSDWLVSRDAWGNLLFNNPALVDMQEFVEWLVETLGLQDNSTIYIDGSPALSGGYSTYKWGIYYALPSNANYIALSCSENYWVQGTPMNPVTGGYYFFYEDTTGVAGRYQVVLVSTIPFNDYSSGGYFNGVYYEFVKPNETVVKGVINNGGGFEVGNPSGLYYAVCFTNWDSTYLPLNAIVYTRADSELMSLTEFMNNASISMNGNLGIITAEINLPIEDGSYTPGDSITIIDDNPQYSIVDWDGTVTVSNLPAIVSTGYIPVPGDDLNPGLVNAWHPISTLIEMTADSMGMLIGIVYEFPEEVLVPIFAVLGGIIIFGIIHAMKEH